MIFFWVFFFFFVFLGYFSRRGLFHDNVKDKKIDLSWNCANAIVHPGVSIGKKSEWDEVSVLFLTHQSRLQ